MELPSGQQLSLHRDHVTAVVTEVGATLRHLEVDGVAVLDGFAEDAMCDGARGQPLLPWPNRVADGRWSWEGEDHQLALTEPERSCAIHGLTRWANWELVELHADSVHLRFRVHAQPGWPFLLRCDVRYALEPDGLTTTTVLTNVGGRPCPAAAGAHPYLSAGGGTVDACRVVVPAATLLPTDERGIPTGRAPVGAHDLDLRSSTLLGDRPVDLAFTDLERGSDGRAVVRLERPDGWAAELWLDEGYPYVEVFTGDTLAPERRRRGLGVEPMTAPPNALQTGEDLVVLQPEESLTLQWGLRLTR